MSQKSETTRAKITDLPGTASELSAEALGPMAGVQLREITGSEIEGVTGGAGTTPADFLHRVHLRLVGYSHHYMDQINP